jgi:hypothetical protein
MNTTEIKQAIGIQYPTQELADIAQQLLEITAQFEQGQMSESEYKELIQDIQLNQSIAESATELQHKQYLHNILTTIVSAASIVAG